MSDTPPQLDDQDEPFDLESEPLESPGMDGNDWGGDGSDPFRPVRAHVLEALRPATGPYAPPLDALLAIGDIPPAELEERRLALGIGQEHVDELLRMARDRALNTADSDSKEVSAPLNALYILSNLELGDEVAEIVPLLDIDFDILSEELPEVFGKVGAPALAPLQAYLRDRTRWVWGHGRAAEALEQIARVHPELREQAVATLSEVLEQAETYHEMSVTGAMGALVDLEEANALPLIRRAFELDKIDESMYGPWSEVQSELGVQPDLADPLVARSQQRFDDRNRRMFPPDLEANLEAFRAQQGAQQRTEHVHVERSPAPQKRKQDQARKAKSKRKAAAASRKANKKKRK